MSFTVKFDEFLFFYLINKHVTFKVSSRLGYYGFLKYDYL
jgi:hypothetical protein